MFLTALLTVLAMLLLDPPGELRWRHFPRITQAHANDRIVVIAPHIDDESIGAAGFLADAVAGGAQVYVVFLTAGDCNRFAARVMTRSPRPGTDAYLAVGRRRIREAKAAMRLLGVDDKRVFVLGYPDRGLLDMLDQPAAVVRSRGTGQTAVPYDDASNPNAEYKLANIVGDLASIIQRAQPTTIIAPAEFDRHDDHEAAAEITDMALATARVDPIRLGYLVHSRRTSKSLVWLPERALLPPRRHRARTWAVYPLSETLQRRKDAVLRTYKSQRPFVFLLRNQFVRSNELFVIEERAAMRVVAGAGDDAKSK